MIYLDYNAGAPVRAEVASEMARVLEAGPGNASSLHSRGRNARGLIESARERLAGVLGVSASEIIFTGGGSEADNLALRGVARARGGGHLVTTAIEHPAVLAAARALEEDGFGLTVVRPDSRGIVDPAAIAAALRPETFLVSVMAANNETGSLQPLGEIAKLLEGKGILFHSDAIQALGKISFRPGFLDLAAFSAHKLGGPQGVGALYLRAGTRLRPLIYGGGQERALRAGTENVAGIAGFALAAELAAAELEDYTRRLGALRDLFESKIMAAVAGTVRHGQTGLRLPNTSSFSFPGTEGEAVVLGLDARLVAASTGSACSSGKIEASHVLTAMGVPPAQGRAAVRFSLGPGNTEEEVATAASAVIEVVLSLRRRA